MTGRKGKFIVFEGIDGAGKTTQAKLLAKRLEEKGRACVLTAEPTSLPSGAILREALSGQTKRTDCEMAALFVFDRIAHNADPEAGIAKLLSDGKDVICDRYYYSSLAYQGSSTDYGWVRSMNLGCPEILKPDVCIFLDLTPEQSLRRIKRRHEAVEIYENIETLTRVRNSFFRVFDDLAETECIAVLDACRPEEEIADDIFDIYLAAGE